MRAATLLVLLSLAACASSPRPAPSAVQPSEPPPRSDASAAAEEARERPPAVPSQRREPDDEGTKAPTAAPRPAARPEPGAVTTAAEAAGAGQDEEPPPEPSKPTAPRPAAKRQVEYERILGTFSIDPELYIYLTPATCAAGFDARSDDSGFAALAEAFAAAGARRGEAAARLNWGAVLWTLGSGEDAYVQVMRAQALFAELGDADGLAHAYEWLGYFFRESADGDEAAEHLSVAYRLYGVLEDHAGAERVLTYADR